MIAGLLALIFVIFPTPVAIFLLALVVIYVIFCIFKLVKLVLDAIPFL